MLADVELSEPPERGALEDLRELSSRPTGRTPILDPATLVAPRGETIARAGNPWPRSGTLASRHRSACAGPSPASTGGYLARSPAHWREIRCVASIEHSSIRTADTRWRHAAFIAICTKQEVSVGSLLPSAVESCARGEDNLRDRGVVVVGTVARATGKGDAMTSGNAGFFSGSGLREKTGLAGTSRQLRLRCADVHPVHCDAEWTAPSASELVAIAVEHGAHAHGFTPRWYTAERIAGISRGVRG